MHHPDIFKLLKAKKSSAIVSYIWRRHGRATCADIVRDLRLSNANVFPAVDGLVRSGMIEGIETAAGNKGRKPRHLRIRGEQCHALGIAFHSQGADISIINAALQHVDTETAANLPRNEKPALQRVLAAARAMIKRHKLNPERLAGVGFTMPGMLDCERGVVFRSTCFKPDLNLSISGFFERALHRPCLVLGNAAALALTEKHWGKAADLSNFLYLAGMGLGMYLNGRLFTGHQGCGGEIGFMKIGEGGPLSADGRTGTFNQLSPFRRIGLHLSEAVQNGAQTMAVEWLRAGQEPGLDLVVEAALRGDALCRELLVEGFNMVAEIAVGLNYLFNPEAIFLLPWTAQCADVSLDIVRRRMELCKMINPSARVQVMAAKYGREYLSRGVAFLPINRLFTA